MAAVIVQIVCRKKINKLKDTRSTVDSANEARTLAGALLAHSLARRGQTPTKTTGNTLAAQTECDALSCSWFCNTIIITADSLFLLTCTLSPKIALLN